MHYLLEPWNLVELEFPIRLGNQTLPKDGKVHIFHVFHGKICQLFPGHYRHFRGNSDKLIGN